MLGGQNILVGITGGIAAYKTAFLVRLLKKAGANVKVVMTENASSFVSPLTLATLSENPVGIQFTKTTEIGELSCNNHVEMGLWADYMIVAPATANTLAKMASGQADNLLLVAYLSAKCPVLIAPAMDLDMYKHPTTKENLSILEDNGHTIIPVGDGPLASGLSGEGRMAEPEEILDFLIQYHRKNLKLYQKKVLITAGPTYEAIDPVRYIGNHSSGKMGFEIAKAAANLGAKVVLISGPTHQNVSHSLIEVVPVISAQDMYGAVHERFETVDIAVLSAAVADFSPKEVASQKIKKKTDTLTLELTKTKDILASLGEIKKQQYLVGFALETNNELENAKGKLKKKNLDLIVLNSLNDKGAGFKSDTNKVTFIDNKNQITEFKLKSKAEVATDLMNKIISEINA